MKIGLSLSVVLAIGLCAIVSSAAGAPPAALDTNSLGQLYLNYPEARVIQLHPGAYGWMVIQSYMRQHVNLATVKSNSPQLRLFMYFNASGYYTNTDPAWPAGMPYNWTKTNHPDWLLKDSAGQDIRFWHGTLHLYDVGNPAYQDEWARRAIHYARSGGFDGIFADDINMGESFQNGWSAPSTNYSTHLAWTRAVESFLMNVCPKIRAAGLSLVPNVASVWNSDRPTQLRWARIAGAYGREHYGSWPGDKQLLGGADWAWMASLHRDIVAAGIPFYAYPHGGAKAADKMRYTRCSFLLWHEPGTGGSFAYNTDAGDPYDTAWAFELGPAFGPAVQASPGVWKRAFAKGSITVDSKAKTAAISAP